MSEIRKDPLTGRWVITGVITGVKEHRKDVFELITTRQEIRGHCPFCPGNEGDTLPELFAFRDFKTAPDSPGWRVRVIPNKYGLLKRENPDQISGELYQRMGGFGKQEIVIETPQHIRSFSDLPSRQISSIQVKEVLSAYKKRLLEIKKDPKIKYVVVFHNQGYETKWSIIHPHSHIIGLPFIPKAIQEELNSSRDYFKKNNKCIFCDIIKEELSFRGRIIEEGEKFLIFCPFASRFPFESQIIPKEHFSDFTEIESEELGELANALRTILQKTSRLLSDPPLNFVLHIPPFWPPEGDWEMLKKSYHWHIEILPHPMPIQGFEWGTDSYLNPPTPELAAKLLREK